MDGSPPIPLKKTLLLVNQFVIDTTRFINHFSTLVEEKLQKVSHDIARIETSLVLLESRLSTIEVFDNTEFAQTLAGPPTATLALSASTGVAATAAPAEAGSDAGAAATPAPASGAAVSSSAVTSSAGVAAPPPIAAPSGVAPPPLPVPAAAPAAAAAAAPPPAPAPEPEPPAASFVSLGACPSYGPFFKMLKVGVPMPAVAIKMRMAGLDETQIEKDPSEPSPIQ